MRRALLCVALVAGAAGAWRCGPHARSSSHPHELPYRYRFQPQSIAKLDASERIAALASKVAVPQPAPLDLAELADLYAQRSQLSGDQDDYARALAAAKQSIELLPAPNGARMTLAKLANMRHDFREAIAQTNEYLKSGNSPSAYLALATAYLALGELVSAADAADTAVDARPRTASYLMRALVLEAQGRDAEAEADFEHAVVVEDFGDADESARLRALWGRYLIRRGQYDDAAKILAEALRVVPEQPLVLAQQGELALRQGRYTEAIALFDRAFAGGRELRYLMDRARAQQLKGDAAGATATRAQVETLVRGELETTGLGHRLDLVETLVDRGGTADVAEAIKLARSEVTHRPSAETHFQLARALARGGTWAEAGTEIRRALAIGVHDARVYELASRIERKVGNVARADLYAGEARRFDPANKGWRMLGMP